MAVVAYAAATLAALRIPPTQVAAAPATAAESAELRGVGILLAASAMGLVRGIVGFLTFLLLFDLRDEPHVADRRRARSSPARARCSGRRWPRRCAASFPEERMLTLALVGGRRRAASRPRGSAGWPGSMLLAAIVAIVSTAGRLAFDSLVQRDAPDANRGRSFAAFELRFQIVWVVGAVIPVLIPIPLRVGFLVIAGGAASPCSPTSAGQRAAHRDPRRPPAGDDRGPDEPDADPTLADHTAIQPAPVVDPTTLRSSAPAALRRRRAPPQEGDGAERPHRRRRRPAAPERELLAAARAERGPRARPGGRRRRPPRWTDAGSQPSARRRSLATTHGWTVKGSSAGGVGARPQRHRIPARRMASRSGSRTRGAPPARRAHGVAADPAVGRHVARAVEPAAPGEVDGGGEVADVEELRGRLVVGDRQRGGAGRGPWRASRCRSAARR